MYFLLSFIWFIGTSNGDNVRNRSPFVRFTITDPETRQITVAGQYPLNSTPPGTHTSTVTNTSKYLNFINSMMFIVFDLLILNLLLCTN